MSYLDLLPGDIMEKIIKKVDYKTLNLSKNIYEKYPFFDKILLEKFKQRRAKTININLSKSLIESYNLDINSLVFYQNFDLMINHINSELLEIAKKNNLEKGDIINICGIDHGEYKFQLIFEDPEIKRINRCEINIKEFHVSYWDIQFSVLFDVKYYRDQIAQSILNDEEINFLYMGDKVKLSLTNLSRDHQERLFLCLCWLNRDEGYISHLTDIFICDKYYDFVLFINSYYFDVIECDEILINTYNYIIKHFQQRINKLSLSEDKLKEIEEMMKFKTFEHLSNVNDMLLS